MDNVDLNNLRFPFHLLRQLLYQFILSFIFFILSKNTFILINQIKCELFNFFSLCFNDFTQIYTILYNLIC